MNEKRLAYGDLMKMPLAEFRGIVDAIRRADFEALGIPFKEWVHWKRDDETGDVVFFYE